MLIFLVVVFLPILLVVEIYLELHKACRRLPTDALSVVVRPGIVPPAPPAPLLRVRVRLLTPGTALPPAVVLSSPGSDHLRVLAGHNTPLRPATLPRRGQLQSQMLPYKLPSFPCLLRDPGLFRGFGAPCSLSHS